MWSWSAEGWSARRPRSSSGSGAPARCSYDARRRGPSDRRGRRDPVARDDQARRSRVGRARAGCGLALRRVAPAARRRDGVGTLRDPAAGDARLGRAGVGVGRASGRPVRRRSAPDEARAMVPVLGPVVRALHHPAAARVDGRLLCAAVRQAAVAQHGVAIREERVEHVQALLDDADAVVIAGGAWSRRISQAARRAAARRARCAVRSSTSASPGTTPAPGRSSNRCSATTSCRGPIARVAVGATVEDAGFTPDVTAGGVHEVLRETLRVLPGLANATLREVRVGLRPASVDDMPIIGALPGVASVSSSHRARRQRPAARPRVGRARRRRRPRQHPRAGARPVLARPLRPARLTFCERSQRSSFSARSAMMFFCTSVGPAPIVV